MFIKSRSEFFKKNLFALLILLSLLIHGIIFFLSPQASQILNMTSLRESFIREPDEYVVTFEVENTDLQKKDITNKHKKGKETEKKYKTFTDTSDNLKDEEPSVETDKIGEKGAIAKDNFPNDQKPINNQPHAEGRSDAPLLGKGQLKLPRVINKEQKSVEQIQVEKELLSEGNVLRSSGKQNKGKKVSEKKEESLKINEHTTQKPLKENDKDGRTLTQEEKELQKQKGKLIADNKKMNQPYRKPLPKHDGIHVIDAPEDIKGDPAESKKLSALQSTEKEGEKNLFEEMPPETEQKTDTHSEIYEGATNKTKNDAGEQNVTNKMKKTRPALNVNAANGEGSADEPVLFEDTISNAEVPGAPSFNVKKHKYAAYFKHIRNRISVHWLYKYGTRAEISLKTEEDEPIIIEFKVLPDGVIDSVNIVSDAGNLLLASKLASSIKSASPLDPFPSHLKEPSIDVRFNFYFF